LALALTGMAEDLDFEKWEVAIGKLILACSRVEYEISRLYEKWMPTRNYHADSYLGRYDKAIGVANTSLNRGDLIAERLVEMKKFAEYRHIVAHNPIHYSDETDSWYIFDSKGQKPEVNLNDLISLSARASEVAIYLAVLLRIHV